MTVFIYHGACVHCLRLLPRAGLTCSARCSAELERAMDREMEENRRRYQASRRRRERAA